MAASASSRPTWPRRRSRGDGESRARRASSTRASGFASAWGAARCSSPGARTECRSLTRTGTPISRPARGRCSTSPAPGTPWSPPSRPRSQRAPRCPRRASSRTTPRASSSRRAAPRRRARSGSSSRWRIWRLGELLAPAEAARRRAAARALGQRFVLTNGCFDVIHPGHVELFRRAKDLGHYLLVAVNSDRSVRALKGPGRPLQGEQARAAVVAALRPVDGVILFDEETPLRLIESLLPDVLVKGGDYAPDQVVGREAVERAGGRVVIVPLLPGYSSSSILDRAAAPR